MVSTRTVIVQQYEIAETTLEEQEFQKYAIVEEAVFSELTKYMEELLDNPKVVRFIEVTSRYVQCIKNNGVSEVESHTKKNLRRKLENLYGSKIHFVSNDSGHLLMLPNSMSRDDLVRMNDQLSAKLKAIETCSDKNLITAACIIRNENLQLQSGNVWPPTPEDLSEFHLPKNTHLFLQSLLRGDNRIQHSSRVSRLIWSFGPDFTHAVTEGKFKTPKHILLPFALESLSRIVVELTKLLNRCGHGLSYSQIGEIETAIAMQTISAGEEQHLVIPRNIVANAFTHLA
ncbi:unnamed protein product [Acanthoscelides obtectus]|uniref:Uncharacterized protein n=1 Tax=Acanthoscelides obtectus TaxID=200917 RepID=A0A9P0LFY7_ACAOB|nr:unnamed protein product [Acanthoscelides obtectus]CAK1646848.1 hypothetical protein AOBTE_LOCUS14895 [Acanthoscelides obtectus]